MNNLKRLSCCYLLIVGLASCGKPLPALEGVDAVRWKNDRNGCHGDRAAMLSAIQQEKKKLEGLTEAQISQLLGRPDQNELYKRNQKFYHYFIQPAPACPAARPNALRLTIRFNATERAKDILIE